MRKSLINFIAIALLSAWTSTGVFVSLAPIPALAQTVDKGLLDKAVTDKFYRDREGRPFWTRESGLTAQGEDLLEAIEKAWTHGLNPARYHLAEIEKLIDKNGKQEILEKTLSDSYARLARDLSGMRVSPASLGLESVGWLKPAKAARAFEILAQEGDVEDALAYFTPQGGTYKKLRAELIRLSKEPPPASEKLLPIRLPGQIKPGMSHPDIAKVRARLGAGSRRERPEYYDDALAAAVMRFQRENGLNADGVIGAKTLQLLNRTRADKIRQLMLNLERLRWLPDKKPDRFIVVNVPTMTLWAIDKGRVALDMPVIVGKPERPTKSFVAQITGVRFNPTWTVPPTIRREDIFPKMQEDPAYMSDKGMRVARIDENGQAVALDPASLDWEDMTDEELARLRMVQGAGTNNPLGKIRILMPNSFDMYLHDTNHPDYFNAPDRMISSGCMRMKDPEAVAAFILAGEEGWSRDKMDALIASGKTIDVPVKRRMPVYVLYYTAWVGEDGRVVYGLDAYGEDAALYKALRAIDGIPSLSQNASGD